MCSAYQLGGQRERRRPIGNHRRRRHKHGINTDNRSVVCDERVIECRRRAKRALHGGTHGGGGDR